MRVLEVEFVIGIQFTGIGKWMRWFNFIVVHRVDFEWSTDLGMWIYYDFVTVFVFLFEIFCQGLLLPVNLFVNVVNEVETLSSCDDRIYI